jgi:formiminotetrahydrofolate cyclodeaminase
MEVVVEGFQSSYRTNEITIYQSSLKQILDKDMTHGHTDMNTILIPKQRIQQYQHSSRQTSQKTTMADPWKIVNHEYRAEDTLLCDK